MNKKLLFLLLPFFFLSFSPSFAQILNEGFEGPSFPPTGWHTKNILGGVAWMRANGGHTGLHSAIIGWEVAGGEDWLVTPQLNISSGDSLKFWARKFFNSNYPPDSLHILVSNTDTAVTSFTTLLATYNVNAFPYGWTTQYAANLTSFAGMNVYIAFKHFDVNGNGLLIDDITIDLPVPVELTSFTAMAIENDVMLSWITATELNNRGFYIERRNDSESWNNLGFVEGHGTTTEKQSYTFLDKNLSSGIYIYRLKQIDTDGSFEYSNEIEVDLGMPIEFSLSQNYPNPFNPLTIIRYSIPKSSNVIIKVFDVLGNDIGTLINDFNSSGLPSGVYFYRLQAGSFIEIKKMILMK
jgi:Secretion system C-terminal sorting domain/Cleaved Adhesin Domain